MYIIIIIIIISCSKGGFYNTIHHITLYPLDSTIGFPNTGQCYPSFEQRGPDVCTDYSQARSSVPPKTINELLFEI